MAAKPMLWGDVEKPENAAKPGIQQIIREQDKDVRPHIEPILTSFLMTEPILDYLIVSKDCFIKRQSKLLKIPAVNENNVIFHRRLSKVELSFEGYKDLDEDSATSITFNKKEYKTLDDMRSFVHDYTFCILAKHTDKKLYTKFPEVKDSYDNKSPDVILDSPTAFIVIEFATTRSNDEGTLKFDYDAKLFKYEEPIRRRIEAKKALNETGIAYTYMPLVVNSHALAHPTFLEIKSELVNELCARFRFAKNIYDEAHRQGMVVAEDSRAQNLVDVQNQFDSIEMVYQNEGDAYIALTRDRLDTSNITTKEAFDWAYAKYNDYIMEAMRGLKEDRGDPPTYEQIMKLVKKATVGNRTDRGSVLQLPGVVPNSNPWEPYADYTVDDPLGKLWNSAITQTYHSSWKYETPEDELLSRALDEALEQYNKNAKYKSRRIYKRVKLDLNMSQRVEFAKVGVQGKELSEHPEVKDYRDRKREGLDINMNVSYIDRFLTTGCVKFEQPPTSTELARSLLDSSLAMHSKDHGSHSDYLNELQKLDLLHWCNFISDVASELAISLKQNVDKDEFVLKKLRFLNCYLLIKPTNSTSHIFYSICLPKDSTIVVPSPISKHGVTHGNSIIYPWVSADESKLVNMIKAESNCLTMLAQWSRFYEVIESPELNSQVQSMLKVSLLVSLEDKPQTEEIMTLVRYVCMEKFSRIAQDSTKMVSKLPKVVRSLLSVWSIKKLCHCMSEQGYDPLTTNGKITGWNNMMNPFTHEPVKYFRHLIELFYVGYSTNKNAKSWANVDFKLINKIVKYEDLLTFANPDYCGILEKDGCYSFHEWSRMMNCAAADAVILQLNRANPDCWKNTLDEDIQRRISKLTWEDLATLKASSTFNPHADRELTKIGKNNHKYIMKRRKAMEAIIAERDLLGDKPADSIANVLKWLEDDGGLRVDIFKKNQHGGTREIYVLEIKSRIIQLILEEICKAVSTYLPLEMMVHSKEKIRRMQEHMYQASKDESKYRANVSSSNDASVWNQGHHVAKFAQFLLRILPPRYHGFIVRALSLWTKKRIALPDGVYTALKKNPNLTKFDQIDDKICRVWQGREQSRWLRTGGNHLEIETGMMQGILHFMSSLFHCGILILRDQLWFQLCRTVSVKSRTVDETSSDDTARSTVVYAEEKSSLKKALILAHSDHIQMTKLSNQMGITMSPKSTIAASNIVEFNSEYYSGASLYRPSIKWAQSALEIVEVESLTERQEIMYNQITQLLEGGAGFFQAAITQYAQGLLNYRLIGCSVNPLFREYTTRLLEIKDPALGYFMLDHPRAAGMPGMSYNLWRHMTMTPRLSAVYNELLTGSNLTTTTTGQLTRGAQIRFGNRQKTLKLIDSLDKEFPDWRLKIEETPSVLYLFPDSKMASMLRILVKITSPSVIRSLSTGNSLSRLMASGVYIISEAATSLGSNWLDALQEHIGNDPPRKVSLLYLLSKQIIGREGLSAEAELVLFPHKDQFVRMKDLIESLDTHTLVPHEMRKSLRSHIQIYTPNPKLIYTLEQIVKWKWFGSTLNSSDFVLEDVWKLYKSMYPWLCSTAKGTLESDLNPGFETHIQLRNFIARQGDKGRYLHLTGSPLRDSNINDMMYTALVRNQFPNHILTPNDASLAPIPSLVSLTSRLACLIELPLKSTKKSELIGKELSDSQTLWDGTSWNVSEKRITLQLFKDFFGLGVSRHGLQISRLRKLFRQSKSGVLGGFTIVQDLVKDKWVGKGVWVGSIGKIAIQLEIYDQYLVHVTTNDIERLRCHEEELARLLPELHVTSVLPVEMYYDTNLRLGPRASRPGIYFDMKTFRKDVSGAPVHVAKFGEVSDISVSKIEVRYTDNSMRLVHPIEQISTVRRGENVDRGDYTLLKYQIKTMDHNFMEKKHYSNKIIDSWVNNKELDYRRVKRLLKRIRDNESPVIYNRDALIRFVKAGLVPALIRAGWDFDKPLIAQSELIEDTDDGDVMLMDDLDFKFTPLAEFEDMFFEEDDDSDDLNDDIIEMDEEDAYDFITQETLLEDTYKRAGDIRRVHNFFMQYARETFDKFSLRARMKVAARSLTTDHLDLLENLIYFYNWDFSPDDTVSSEATDLTDDEF